eukprot:m.91598 g.91598  ORF g.91598 m.91598 type:complete len:1074 (-) comp26486_c1_seq1:257-3478(-)
MSEVAEVVAAPSNKKLVELTAIEAEIRQQWEDSKAFEIDAPTDGAAKANESYFATFPYPYSNGKLHLGHAFSLSKAEFAVGFQRLLGKKCLFPLGFHCTGMPIKAAADKLKNEIEQFGCPPVFPVVVPDPSAKQHAKIEAKTGGETRQWTIMEKSGVAVEDIPKFMDANFWLGYFPPMGVTDAKLLGLKIDWRRSFITTPVNAYYDSFVQWQFLHLKEKNKIKFGKRYTVYSPKDGQACMDHDRSEGEGKALTDYTGIKMKLLAPFPKSVESFQDKNIFLVAATLRPETMYGQTNCWVSPKLNYIAYKINETDVLITTRRAARNISWQMFDADSGQGVKGNTLGPEGTVHELGVVPGDDLIGCKVNAPYSLYDEVYCLPLMTIKEDMGTGIVTSVPSDSPDDWAGLRDLQKKAAMRAKFNLTDEMVLPFAPKSIISIPDYSDLSAIKACDDLGILSQNDRERLDEAKDICYNHGFHHGIMKVGSCAGKKVHVAKDKVREELLAKDMAFIYKEPEALIMSRSQDVCVGGLCDQWYLVYGEPVWRDQVKEYVNGDFECFDQATKDKFNASLDWLHEHACSRIYGLGSRLPWDDQWLIESLSDSTIYMAYYTVAHLLHGGTLDGSGVSPCGIKAEDLTREAWDFIFLGVKTSDACKIPLATLQKLRNEFMYFYPMDLRVSGKDLVPNHLTYSLYNHAAIFPKEMWPRGFRTNGFLNLNHKKMSKSTGNWITLEEAVETYTADATRLTLADAGDSVEDANFEIQSATANLLRLYKENEWVEETLKELPTMRAGPITSFLDRAFLNIISKAVVATKEHYVNMHYREALRTGFFELQKSRDQYRDMTKLNGVGMHRDLIVHFIDMQYILLAPFAPHGCEHVWKLLGKEGTMVGNGRWPEAPTVDVGMLAAFEYLLDIAHALRKKKIEVEKKTGKAALGGPVKTAVVYVAAEYPAWQTAILAALDGVYDDKTNSLPENKELMGVLRDTLKNFEQMKDKKFFAKTAMSFVAMVRSNLKIKQRGALRSVMVFDEMATVKANASYLELSLGVESLEIKALSETSEKKIVDKCVPGEPLPVFFA